jgi:Holliday junction DNA helicase RuvA
MIDFLKGRIDQVGENAILLIVSNAVGFSIHVPRPKDFTLNQEYALYVYFHWSQENGPSLYGFSTDLDKTLFLLIIECPKIGPGIALNILSQLSASQFISLLMQNDEKTLSKVNGIGPKKAAQLILTLRDKIEKMVMDGDLAVEKTEETAIFQQLSQVLTSLNYSKQEIGRATQYVMDTYKDRQSSLDQMIRSALTFLASRQ